MDKDKFFTWLVVKQHNAPNSIRNARLRYDILFKWLGRRRLNAKNAEKFIFYLRQKKVYTGRKRNQYQELRNSSLNSYVRVINLIDIFERENGHDYNLMRHISYFPKEAVVPVIFTFEELQALLNTWVPYVAHPTLFPNATPETMNRNMKLLLWTIIATGCRYEEGAQLTRERVHLGINGGDVLFTKTKNGDDRQVPIPPTLAEALREHLKDRKPTDFCFQSAAGHKICEQIFNKDLKIRADQAGLTKRAHAHAFRHSYIMEHIRRGTDVITIAHLVGHKDLTTTMNYTKYNWDDLLRGAENHPFFSMTLPPEKILDKIQDSIDKWPIKNDRRFSRTVTRKDNKILVEVSINEGV